MRNLIFAATLGLLALAGPGQAGADQEVKQCLREARGLAQFCRAECRENYQMDRDECRSVDHECAELCRDDRNECLVDIYSALDSCQTPCDDDLGSAIEQCRLNWRPRTEPRERCVKLAKLAAYRCHAGCRVGVKDEIKECRLDHRQCLRDCREDASPD